MRIVISCVLLLISGCQLMSPRQSDVVYLSKDVVFPIQKVASGKLEVQLAHQVTYQSSDKQRFDYLVQLDINASRNSMALVATSLLGIPLISFEMQDKKIKAVNRTSDKLPAAERLVADLQFMFWPKEQLALADGVTVKEECDQTCMRYIFINNKAVAEVEYVGSRLLGLIQFKSLLHDYHMTIKNL